jgi:hypothetical protein
MINEVQLIAWRKAIEDSIKYTGTCVDAQPTDTALFVNIDPIAGISASDLEGLYITLTNELNQSQTFPILDSSVDGSVWRITTYSFVDLSQYDFSNYATYEIGTRNFIGSPTGDCVSTITLLTSGFIINGDVTYLLHKNIQVNLDNGETYNWYVTIATYIPLNDWTIVQFDMYFPTATGINGTYSVVFDTAPFYLDLYPNESISQNYQFTDIGSFGATGEFSREFRVPCTSENMKIFGLLENVNFNDSLNYFHTKLNAEIRVNTFPVAIGHLRVIKAYTQNAQYSDLELSFYGASPDIVRSIGDNKLKDINDLSTLNHYLFKDMIANNVAVITYGSVQSGGGIGVNNVYIEEQDNLNFFMGKTLRLDNGTTTTTRVINYVDDGGLSQDKLGFAIALDQDYSSGTWQLIDDSILDNVRYALCDRGQKWDETGVTGSRPISNENQPLYAGDMTPHLNAWWIFSKIINDAGFELNPTPLESILQSYWIPWINSPSIQVSNQDNQYLFRAQLTSNTDYDYGDLLSFTEVYDNDSLYTGGAYSVPFPAYYTFRVWLTFQPVNLYNASQTISFQVKIGGVVLHTHNVYISQADILAGNPINVQFTTPSLLIDPNQYGVPAVSIYTYTLYNGTTFYGTASYDPNNGSGWELVSIANPMYDALVQIGQNAPDIKQIDFLKDIINMHCCAVVPDRNKPFVLSIIPMNDFINSGETLDWTSKLDISKDIVVSPTTDKQKRNLLFTYKGGGDVASKFYQDNGRIYGEYKIDGYQVSPEDPYNDFAEGELKVQLTAESNPSNYVRGTSLVISKYVNDKWEFVVPNLRFVYMSDIGLVKMYNEQTELVEDVEVYVTNNYSDSYSDITDYDLNFAPEVPLHVIESNPYKNLFNQYWRDYLNELYSPRARMLEASFSLDLLDIQSFSFADKIWIKDSYWRILQVNDYKMGMEESTRVILLKTDISQPDCTSVPVSEENGWIQFEDYEGNPVDASATCCIRYGYSWNKKLKLCASRGESTNQPSDPTGGGANTMASVMQGQTIEPTMKIAMVTGSNVSPDNSWSSYVGRDITIPEDNQFTTAHGDYLKSISGQPSSALLGSNVLAPIKGLHFGGGWRGERLSSKEGSQQTGLIVIGNEYIFNSTGDEVELFVGNETLTRLSIEDETSMSILIHSHVSNQLGFWATSLYSAMIWKTGGITYRSLPIQLMIDDSIGGQFDLRPVIDIGTNTSEHRFKISMVDLGSYIYPTPAVQVISTIQYTQTR